MARADGSRRRLWWLAASAVLPVALAVAGNQILNDKGWTWWWAPIALVASAALVAVTERLTRPSADAGSPKVDGMPDARPASGSAAAKSNVQVNVSGPEGGPLYAVQDGPMNIHHYGPVVHEPAVGDREPSGGSAEDQAPPGVRDE